MSGWTAAVATAQAHRFRGRLALAGIALGVACSRPPRAAETERSSPPATQSEVGPPSPTPPKSTSSPAPSSARRGAERTPSPSAAELRHELRAFPGDTPKVHRFSVPLSRTRFSFVDLAYRTPLVQALGSAELLFNGGYWAYSGEQRVIQGLVVVEGVKHARKSAASGGVLEVRAGQARLIDSRHYRAEPAKDTALALQCSPRLVVDGHLIPRLNTSQRAARTALCIPEDDRTLRIYLTEPDHRPTLLQLAQFLLGEGCVDALNLDGGPSTAAVARAAEPSGSGQPTAPLTIGYGAALPYGIAVNLQP